MKNKTYETIGILPKQTAKQKKIGEKMCDKELYKTNRWQIIVIGMFRMNLKTRYMFIMNMQLNVR